MLSDADQDQRVGSSVAVSALRTLDRVDKRSRLWRRRKRRRTEIIDSLGGEQRLTPHQREHVDLLLGLSAVVEGYGAQLAAGLEIDVERYLSAVKEQRRVIEELGLPRNVTPPAPIRDRMRGAAA